MDRRLLLLSIMFAVGAAGCGTPTVPDDVSLDSRVDAFVFDGPRPSDAPADHHADVDVIQPTVDVFYFDAAVDTGSADASSPGDVPIGGRDTAPPDRCSVLAESYAAAVRTAQSCRTSEDCGTLVCETLCCGCSVYVGIDAAGLSALDALRAEWQASRCADAIMCPAFRCAEAVAGECSSSGRCVTIRRGM